MADEKPTLHIDNDWKRQAQEEKKKLAEQEAKKAKESAPPVAAAPISGVPAGRGARSASRMPEASFATLVQTLLTQALYYLGDLGSRGTEPNLNLDMAKHQIDLLGILEDKTRNNLIEDESKLLDTALYEARNRFVNVAAQMI